jgi:transposase
MEEGTQSAWMYELLEREVEELVVTIPERHSGPKDDERDAWELAEKLRTKAVRRRVFKAGESFSELRAAVRSYEVVVSDLVRAKNRLKGLYRSRGIQAPGRWVYAPTAAAHVDRQLPAAQWASAAMLRVQIEALRELKKRALQRLLEASKAHPIIRTISTAPAIGPIRAAQIAAIVVTPHRFRTKRQFWAYCGLGVVTRSSADWGKDKHGNWVRAQAALTRGLNRNRQPVLKAVFKGAAHQIAAQMPKHPLNADYRRLLAGDVKPNLALLTIARRIAATVLAMWKHEEAYDPRKNTVHMRASA